MFGLVLIVVMTLSGHLSDINPKRPGLFGQLNTRGGGIHPFWET